MWKWIALCLVIGAGAARADTTMPGGNCNNTGTGASAPNQMLGSTGLGTGCAGMAGGTVSNDGQTQLYLFPGVGAAASGTVTFYNTHNYPGSHPTGVFGPGIAQPPYTQQGFPNAMWPVGTTFTMTYCNDGTGDAGMFGGVPGQPGPQIIVIWQLPPGAALMPGHLYAIFGVVPPKAYDFGVSEGSCTQCTPTPPPP